MRGRVKPSLFVEVMSEDAGGADFRARLERNADQAFVGQIADAIDCFIKGANQCVEAGTPIVTKNIFQPSAN